MLKIMNLVYWYCFFNRRRLMEKKNDIKCFFNKIMMEFSDVLLVMYIECVLFIKKIMNVKWENIKLWYVFLYF